VVPSEVTNMFRPLAPWNEGEAFAEDSEEEEEKEEEEELKKNDK